MKRRPNRLTGLQGGFLVIADIQTFVHLVVEFRASVRYEESNCAKEML